MALEIRQSINQELRLTQELVMTPQLQQAIKLLQLSRLELADRVQEEMAENPLLEEAREEEGAGAPEPEGPAEAPEVREEPREGSIEADDRKPEIDWEQYLSYSESGSASDLPATPDDDRPSYENFVARDVTLHDHLLWQLRLSDLSPPQIEIGTLIVGNVDEDGYLRATVTEIASMAGVAPEAVDEVLAVVQDFDPLGVASRDLQECLLKQAEELEISDVAIQIIRHGLKHLETKNYKKLAKELDFDLGDVVEAAREIASLEPRPGSDFTTSRVDYVVPDAYVVKEGEEYLVRLNEDGVPKLRVSPYYQSLLQNDSLEGKEAKGYIQERMQAALWLIRSIHQRQQTLYKVACSIVMFQRDFLDRGLNHLRPLILKDVAEDIGMHESTVSRVTTSKYMHTPQGTFELKFFFSSSIQSRTGEDLASRSVKSRIREIVAKEDPTEPLSDLLIGQILSKEFGLCIARRTVSKYRESLGILPSSGRRRYF